MKAKEDEGSEEANQTCRDDMRDKDQCGDNLIIIDEAVDEGNGPNQNVHQDIAKTSIEVDIADFERHMTLGNIKFCEYAHDNVIGNTNDKGDIETVEFVEIIFDPAPQVCRL